ncbi:MAG: ATP12 family protein [Pseudomonadota bacterium]
MSNPSPKRFYKTVAPLEVGARWTVALDGRPLKTPAKADFFVDRQDLAEAVAEEWNRQGEILDLNGMHLTRLINVVIDRTPSARPGLVDEIVRYCETDLLCFPPIGENRDRILEAWRPIRSWAAETLKIALNEAEGEHLLIDQPAASLEASRAYADACDDLDLTTLGFAAGLYGSALLAMAVCEGYLEAGEAYELSILEEAGQAEKWGWDPEAVARHDARRQEIAVVQTVFSR